jgi:hypothetical protein
MMESTPPRPTATEASAALRDAEAARTTLAGRIAVPAWFFASLGVAIAVQIAMTAVGVGDDAPWLIVGGLAVFAAVAGLQLGRFRRRNGVWLGGFAGRVVLGGATTTSVAYTVALGAAVWAGSGDRWWLVALWSATGGAAYALGGSRWMRRYRGDPAAHARGESLGWLALVTVTAIGGLALLLLNA